MRDPLRDPFLRPGVADEIEAQLQMQEERRVEAERLARAEADIARLRLNVRRGIFAIGTLAAATALVAAVLFADLFHLRRANPVAPAAEPHSPDSPRISAVSVISSSKTRLPLTTRKAESTMPERASLLNIGTDAIETAPASNPPSKVAPAAQPSSITDPTVARADTQPGNPVAPIFQPGIVSSIGEYDLKAAFLLNFAKHVRWPAGASSTADGPFTIGILGNDSFGKALDRTFAGQQIQGLKIAIKRSRAAADLRGAQMVFISTSEEARISEILRSFAGTNTLTIGETRGFAALGGMIEFTVAEQMIRFRLNTPAAKKAGLAVSATLLRLAIL